MPSPKRHGMEEMMVARTASADLIQVRRGDVTDSRKDREEVLDGRGLVPIRSPTQSVELRDWSRVSLRARQRLDVVEDVLRRYCGLSHLTDPSTMMEYVEHVEGRTERHAERRAESSGQRLSSESRERYR